MLRTFISQQSQIASSSIGDDTLAPGLGLVSESTDLESDLNSIRSMLKQLAWGQTNGNWYDNIQTPNSSLDGATPRGINLVNVSLTELREKRFLFRRHNRNEIVIGQHNFVTLNVNDGTAPMGVVASSTNSKGTIVSALGGEEYGIHSLAAISGTSPIRPKNLVLIRNSKSHDVLTTSLGGGQTIYGLLQVESGVDDGDVFNDVNARTQISFVYENEQGLLAPAPVQDVVGKSINYSYIIRDSLSSLPDDASLAGETFVDVPEAFLTSDITFDRALTNQGPKVAHTLTDVNIALAIGKSWVFKSGSNDLFALDSNGNLTISTSTNFNSTGPNTFTSGITTQGAVKIGSTGVEISSGSIKSSLDLSVSSGNRFIFSDNNNPGDLFGLENGIKLTSAADSWQKYNTVYQELGLIDAILSASNDISTLLSSSVHRERFDITITNDMSADVDIGTNSDGITSTGLFEDLSGLDFIKDVKVYLNGILLRSGTGSGQPMDVYPGSLVNNELTNIRFPFALRSGSHVAIVAYSRNGSIEAPEYTAPNYSTYVSGESGGDSSASYIVLSTTGSLSNERALSAGQGISINSSTPGSVVISTTQSIVSGTNASVIGYSPESNLSVSTQTIGTKLIEYVSVKDFGAKGDGISNDTTAIQNCLDYCFTNNKSVFIPTGTYVIYDTLVILWGMTVIGEPGSIIKRANAIDTLSYQTILSSSAYANYISASHTPETNLQQILYRASGDFLRAGKPASDPTATQTDIIDYNMYKAIRDNLTWFRMLTTQHPLNANKKLWADNPNNPTEDSPILRINGITFDGNYQGQGTPHELNFALEQQHCLFLAGSSTGNVNNYGVNNRHRLRTIIENCVFKNAAGDGISIFTSTNVTIKNCHFWNCYRSGPSVLSSNNIIRLVNVTTGGDEFNSVPQLEPTSDVNGKYNNELMISNCYFDALKNNSNLGTGADFGFNILGPNKLNVTNTIFNAGILGCGMGTTASYGVFNNCTIRQIGSAQDGVLFNRPGMLSFSGCEFVLPIISGTIYNNGISPPYRRLMTIKSYLSEPNQADQIVSFNDCLFRTDSDILQNQQEYTVQSVSMLVSAGTQHMASITTTTNHGFNEAVNTLASYDNVLVSLSGFTNPLYNKAYKVTALTANTVRIAFSEKFADNFSFVAGAAKIKLIPMTVGAYVDVMTGSCVSFNNCTFSGFSEALMFNRTKEIVVSNSHFDSFTAMTVNSDGNDVLGADGRSIGVIFSGNTFGKKFSALGLVAIPPGGPGKTKISFHNQEIPAHTSRFQILNSLYMKTNLIVSGSRVLTSNNKPWDKYQTFPGDMWKMNYAAPGQPTVYVSDYPDTTYITSSWYVDNQTVKIGPTASRPSLGSTDKGIMYIDLTLAANGKPIWWNGTSWVDSTGTAV